MSESTASGQQHPGGTAMFAGRTVARIGYGAMQLDRLRHDEDAAVRLVRRAVELGIDHVDTAQFYGHGFVNQVLRQALRPTDGVMLVTKVGADPDPNGPFPMRPAQRPAELRASVQENLRALGVEQIPVVNLRRMDAGQRIPLAADQVVDLDDQLAAMITMRDEGLISGIGLSSVTIDGLRSALPAGIACVQNAYSLVDRSDEAMVQLCAAEGIAWVPYFPLGSAFPGLPKVVDQPAVQQVAAQLARTPAQVGLAWLLCHAPHTLLIPGTASLDHLAGNVAVGGIHLDADAIALLEGISAPAADR